MPTGWWAEVFFAKIAAQAQRATAALVGEQPEAGSIAAQAQRATAALVGEQPEAGSIAAQAQRASAALTGVMQPAGSLAAQAQLAAAAFLGGQTQQGAIAATATKATAALSGTQAVALTIIGTPNTNNGTSVTIPPHQIGDGIFIYAHSDAGTASPTKPSAAGTVPNFNYIDNGPGANSNASTTAYFVATATNHTSGAWGNATGMIAVVVRGQNASPIGGHAESGSTATNGSVAPAITMSNTTGTSMVLECHGRRAGIGFSAWNAAPAGYTRRAALVVSSGVCLNTKDVTTSDGSITQGSDGSATVGYRGATVEILAA